MIVYENHAIARWYIFGDERFMYRLMVLTSLSFLILSCNAGTHQPFESDKLKGNPASDSGLNSNLSSGEEIFRQRCATCHGISGNYRYRNAADLQLSRLDSIGIVNTIKNGKGVMPMFYGAIHDSDLASLELYVKSLRK